MQDGPVDDFDGENERTWTDFRVALGSWLVALEEGSTLAIRPAPSAEAGDVGLPYVLMTRLGSDRLRGEILSDAFPSSRKLSAEDHQFLLAQDWISRSRRDGAYEHPATSSRELLEPVVGVLRWVLGAAHPAFLTTAGVAAAAALGVAPTVSASAVLVDREEVVSPIPRDHDDLVALVGNALADVTGSDVAQNDDDDFILIHELHVVSVRIVAAVPVVAVCVDLVGDVENREAAQREMGILNRRRGWTRFLLLDDTVEMRIEIPCWPFVQAHLEAALKLAFLTISEVADDLLLRVGGEFPHASLIEDWTDEDEDEDEESLDEEDHDEDWLRTNVFADGYLQRLFGEGLHGRAHLEPQLLAAACDNDPAVLHSLLPHIREQEVVWSAARTVALEGEDMAGAARCARWRVRWTATGQAVSRALTLFPDWTPTLPRLLPPSPRTRDGATNDLD